MEKHFNNLTPAQAERLAMLIEECGEVIQVAGKILRHGYDNYHPDRPHITNRELLQRELTDLAAVQNQIHACDRVFISSSMEVDMSWGRKLRYAHHQEELTHD